MTPVRWIALVALAAGGCGSADTPLAPTPSPTPSPTVVGGRWEAAAPIADAGPRPNNACFPAVLCSAAYGPSHPRVAGNARGQAIAAWQRYEGGDYRLYVARFEPGRGWAAEEPIATESAVQDVRVAIDAQANGLLAWRRGDAIQASYGPSGRAWSAPQSLAGGGLPHLAMDESGRAHLLFLQPGVGVFTMAFAAGAWAAPQALQAEREDLPGVDSIGLSVAPGGSAVAAWTRGDPGDERRGVARSSEIWSSRLRPGQGWAAPERIGVLDEASSFDLDALASDDGSGALAYSVFGLRDVFRWAVWGQNTSPGATSWLPPQHLSAPASPTTILKRFPRFATGGRGTALLTWVDQVELPGPDARSDIRARWSTPGRSEWSETTIVAADPASRTTRSGVSSALSAAGNAVVTWQERFDNEHQRLLASHYLPGTGWSAPQEIRVGTLSPRQLTMDASGNATLLWTEWTDDHLRVWSARMSPITR